MKLGLLADIHQHNDDLRQALDAFRQQRVEQVVVLGDVFELGDRIEEACRLLKEVNPIGGEHVVLEIDRTEHIAGAPLRDADLRTIVASPSDPMAAPTDKVLPPPDGNCPPGGKYCTSSLR